MAKHPRAPVLAKTVTMLCPKDDKQVKTDYDTITAFALEKVTDDVVAYCHIPVADLPETLDTTIISMTVHALTELKLLVSTITSDDAVRSLTDGDVSVSFVSPLDVLDKLNGESSITGNFKRVLNSYRRVAQ